MRGHSSIEDAQEKNWSQIHDALIGADTAMLPTWYAVSYIYEKEGYDYAVPFIGSVLFGALPRVYFPWKDDLTKIMLGHEDIRYSRLYKKWFIGPKTTVLGGFYAHGGITGVIIGMALLGWICSRLDRLLLDIKSDITKSIGIVWLANVWMSFASSDIWILQNSFISGLPFIGLWIVSKKKIYKSY